MLQQTARLSDAAQALLREEPEPSLTLGLALLSRTCGDPAVLNNLFEALKTRFGADGSDYGALLDLSTLLLATGNIDTGLQVQAGAIAGQPLYRRITTRPATLRLLIFMRPGDLTANTPVDFLLEGSDVELVQAFIDGPPRFEDMPDHDIALLGIGEAPEAQPLLAALQGAFDHWPRPVLNARPQVIADMTRDGVAARLAGCDALVSPVVRTASRAVLDRIPGGEAPEAVLGDGFAYPIIARPLGSQAGIGMEKIAAPGEMAAYLAGQAGDDFYVTAFHDYAGPDGLYRKYRVVFIDGQPFLAHLAVSPRWMVHYLNADMEGSAANRAEEAVAMDTFEDGFAARHAAAFAHLCAALPLDYFGVDCAETADGQLLVFEADVALIVHAMDPEDLYPYKKPAMARLFAAFVNMLERRAEMTSRG